MVNPEIFAIDSHQLCLDFRISYTVNDKSFEGEKFRGLLGSSGMRGKVSRFFHHHLYTFMVFQLYKTATSVSTKTSCH